MKLLILILLALIAFFGLRAIKKNSAREYALDQSNDQSNDPASNQGDNQQPDDNQSTSHASAIEVSTDSSAEASTGSAIKAGAVAATAAAAGLAGQASQAANDSTANSSTINHNSGQTSIDSASLPWLHGLDTGDTGNDIREMLKILNLRDSDAPRLAISKEQYQQLKTGSNDGISGDDLTSVATKLRNMMA